MKQVTGRSHNAQDYLEPLAFSREDFQFLAVDLSCGASAQLFLNMESRANPGTCWAIFRPKAPHALTLCGYLRKLPKYFHWEIGFVPNLAH